LTLFGVSLDPFEEEAVATVAGAFICRWPALGWSEPRSTDGVKTDHFLTGTTACTSSNAMRKSLAHHSPAARPQFL
jgi:hypothetical protein